MSKKDKKPELRFKGFTETWEQRKLKYIGDIVTGTTPSTSDKENYNGNYLFVSPADIQNNRYVESTITTLSNKGYEKCRKLVSNSILFVSIGSTIGKVAQIKGKAVTNQQINSVICSKNNNSDFVFSLLEKESNSIKKMASAQAVPIINKTTFGEIELNISNNYAEQLKIGTCLKNLDNLITLHQRKYEKLTYIKKAMLEKMFPKNGENVPELRFKGFNETWEQRKFNEIANVQRGLTYSPTDIDKNGIRVLRSSNINNDTFYTSEDDVFVNKNAINIDYANNNDILITSANGSPRLVGKHCIINNIQEKSCVPGGFMLLAKTKESNFLNASMSSNWYKRFIDVYVSGGNGSIGNLSKTDLDNQDLLIPQKEEGDKIGDIFVKIDNLITLHQRKLEKLKNIKKACLEKMFI